MTLHIPEGLSLAPYSRSCCIPTSDNPINTGNELNTTSISTLDLNKRIVPEIKSKSCYSLLGRCLSAMICGYDKTQDAKAKAIFKGFLENTYGNKISDEVIANLKCYTSGSYLTLQDLVDADLLVKKDQEEMSSAALSQREDTSLISITLEERNIATNENVEISSDIVPPSENTSLLGITLEEITSATNQETTIEILENAEIKHVELRQQSESIVEISEDN